MKSLICTLQHIFVILSICVQLLLSDCPSLCECKWKSGKESVICLNASLSAVPLHLDAGTQLLDLTSNNLITVNQDEFSKAGLLNLQKIYISKCRLKSLDRYAFRNLINLVELDLSYNGLTSIPSNAFDSRSELRELDLSGNPIHKIMNDAFIHVPKLNKLELSDCKIDTIEVWAFRKVERTLEWLKLNKNKLVEVKPISLTILRSLRELEVAGNPWNCSCKLRPLREWMLKQNVPFGTPPVCKFPNRLESKSWDKLGLDEFACVPAILALDAKAQGVEGKNVTMTCRITGVPEPNVRWILKNKVIANLSAASLANGKKLYVVQLQNNSSDLTILTADVQDAGVYTCAAENKAGKSEASVTLAVSRKPHENSLSKKVLLASVLAGLFFVLISCSVTLCLCTMRKKYVTQWQNRNRLLEDNYEKIEMNHKIVNLCDKRETGQNEVGHLKKNGDYRLVPGVEVDQDADKADEGFQNALTASNRSQNNVESWSSQVSSRKWSSSELPLLDTDDLHIPRRTVRDIGDDRKSNSPSTSGTYNEDYETNSPININLMNLEKPQLLGYSYASSTSAESSFVEDDFDKKYPDLIEASSTVHKGSLKAISEGNSVSDFSELYCTLPRKSGGQQKEKYCSTDSQFPLLQDSRYSSSGEDSNLDVSSERKLSDGHKYAYSNFQNRATNTKSNSYLNLISRQSSPTKNSTPLLDVNSLDNRVAYRRPIISPSPTPLPSTMVNSYDYHAAQLERFLEEYRSLQKELTKMKESCENFNMEKTPIRYVDPLIGNSCSPLSPTSDNRTSKLSSTRSLMPNSPNSNQTLDNSLSNFGSELSKYLLSSTNASPNNFNDGGVFNG